MFDLTNTVPHSGLELWLLEYLLILNYCVWYIVTSYLSSFLLKAEQVTFLKAAQSVGVSSSL